MTREQRNALLTGMRVAEAVTAVVNQTPAGAPGELLYAAVREHLGRAEFDRMMRALVEARRVGKRGDRYFPAPPET